MKTVSLKPALTMDFSIYRYILVYIVYNDSRVVPESFYCVCMTQGHVIFTFVMHIHQNSRSATLLALSERAGGADGAW